MAKDNIAFEVKEHYGSLGEESKGWRTEVNLVSWNGADPKVDVRRWNEDHTKMSKGLTFTEGEARELAEILYRL